ncbi:MAG: hypothetical protein NT150_12640 [Bacteroidetes bacterium]|nr:hypothetical protein [Bacteroidota bacterium]
MKNLSFILIAFTAVLTLQFGCRKDTLGPSIVGIYGPVTVVDPLNKSMSAVDFSKDETVYFTASFEKETDWVITVKGNTSGATKTFTTISKVVDKSNALWNGTADDVPSFQKETVTIFLTFKHTTDTFKTTMPITGLRNPDKNGILITDFSALKSATDWPRDWPAVTVFDNSHPKADGGKYFYMSGTPWKHQNFDPKLPIEPYVNYMDIASNKADVNHGSTYGLSTDSNKVYFNIMVYGNGPSDTWFLVNFWEEGGVARHINIRPDWTGWKLLSYTYAELLDNVSTPGKPDKLDKVSFVLLSDQVAPYTNAVSVAFDHPIFTINHPYQP